MAGIHLRELSWSEMMPRMHWGEERTWYRSLQQVQDGSWDARKQLNGNVSPARGLMQSEKGGQSQTVRHSLLRDKSESRELCLTGLWEREGGSVVHATNLHCAGALFCVPGPGV